MRVLLLMALGGCSSPEPAQGSATDAEIEPEVTTDAGVEAEAEAAVVCSMDAAAACDGGTLPDDLRCTGLYSCWEPKVVAEEAQAFVPGYTFWSDGADKQRWLSLPPGAKVDTTNMDGWIYPPGTKVWKEFRLGDKRIETRLFAKNAQGVWEKTTYRWSSDEKTASRLDTGAREGGYEIPTVQQCDACHAGMPDRLLGLDAVSLGAPGARGLTLASIGDRLSGPPAKKALQLGETPAANEAIGWLHANCGPCHSESGSAKFTGLLLRVRASKALAGNGSIATSDTDVWRTAVGQPMVRPTYTGNPAYASFLRIRAGDPSRSVIPAVAALRESDGGLAVGQMPPLVTHKADTKGLEILNRWIDAL
jgi:hypothetical protein